MRIVELIPNLASGGAREVYREIIVRLRERGVDVVPVVISGEPSDDSACTFASQVGIHQFLGYTGKLFDLSLRKSALRRLKTLLGHNSETIVHSHLWPAAMLASKCGGEFHHFVHVHDTRPWVKSKKVKDRIRQYLTRSATRKCTFISVSRAAEEYNAGIIGNCERCVIANAVDVRRFSRVEVREASNPIVFGNAARFSEEKGQAILIKAFRRFRDANQDARLLLAGDGRLREDCQRLAGELGVRDSVQFLGQVSPIEQFLKQIDIFVLPSLGCEGMPLTVLEALAAGRSVIASDVPGLSETLAIGKNGTLVPPGNIEALASAMTAAARRRTESSPSDSWPRQRDWNDAVTELLELFRKTAKAN